MTDVEWHRDRRRAESFGAGAADYDRFRPPYADGLFDELAALRPHGVLDVGCGNGRAAAGLVARGVAVLGVERLEHVYADLGVGAGGHGRGVSPFADDPVAADPAFGEVTTEIWREQRTFSATGWIDLLGTFSDHATLEPDRRSALFTALRRAIDELGGTLRATACTHLLRCRRV